MILTYSGTNYSGWQTQLGKAPKPSLQDEVRQAIEKMHGESVSVVASGRTDAGVHALYQVAHFSVQSKFFETDILRKGLNSILPADIRVLKALEVPLDFHAQRSALKKQYSYYFLQGPVAHPFWLERSWWIQKKLDVQAMNDAVKVLLGEHDFRPFQASGAPPDKSTIRRIDEIEVTEQDLPAFPLQRFNDFHFRMVRLRVVGNGFLKQMVRSIAGTALEIGEKRRESTSFTDILENQDRRLVGATAPSKGLTLERVWYTLELS